MSLPAPMTDPGTSVMCSGTALLMATLSDGTLQVLLAVTVQTTSVPGITLPASTRTFDFSPLALTTSFSICAVVLSSMQPGPCPNACVTRPHANSAAMAADFWNSLNMCVSFTSSPVN